MYTIFVYGTLKRGFRLHHCMETAKYVGKHTVKDYTLFDSGYGYPFAIKKQGCHVNGEVYMVDDKTLRLLDSIELGAGYVKAHVPFGVEKATMYIRDVAPNCASMIGYRVVGSDWVQK